MPYAEFIKNIKYDAFGRVESEYSSAEVHGKKTKNTITNTYKNGVHWQIKETATNKILWQTNTTNSRGQLTNATLGNGMTIANTYDSFGYATQFKHDLGTNNVFNLTMQFEPLRSNLTNRYSSLFNLNESFDYDLLDRLTTSRIENAVLYYANFNTTTAGFAYVGGNNGSIICENQKLKVKAPQILCGTKRLIVSNAEAGQTIRIEAEVLRLSGTGIILAIITEVNSGNGAIINSTEIATVGTGVFGTEYTVTSNSNLFLSFLNDGNTVSFKQESSMLLPPSGTSLTYFTVDNVKITKMAQEFQNYDDRGRITNNSNGNYRYQNTEHPYQATEINQVKNTANTYFKANGNLNVNYTAFKSPTDIENLDHDKISFGYNMNQQRSIMYYGSLEDNREDRPYRKYYSADGSMEIKYNSKTNSTEFVTYIGGDGYTAPIIAKSDGEKASYFYLHRDHLGTILAITNNVGSLIEKRHFDPWGNIIWYYNEITGAKEPLINNESVLFLDRGYTGHEHLLSVGLINMNARLYDPVVHRFLQPDAFVQDPTNTQCYNRYGYAANNPLKYNDPSGNILPALLIAAFWGAGIGAATYTLTALLADVPFSVSGLIQAVVISSVTSVATCGIAQGFGAIANFTTTPIGFWQGAAIGASTGFVTGVAGSAINTLVNGGCLKLGQLLQDGLIGAAVGGVIGGISGGLNAQKNDSNFWSGEKNINIDRPVVLGSFNPNRVNPEFNFDDSKWVVKAEMKLQDTFQREPTTCTYHCKTSVDSYFNVTVNNKPWFNYVNTRNGLNPQVTQPMYGHQSYGSYNTLSYELSLNEASTTPWIISEMNNNHIVHVSWVPDSSYPNMWHASLFKRIEQNIINLSYRYKLMDPASWGTFSFSSVRNLFSIWK